MKSYQQRRKYHHVAKHPFLLGFLFICTALLLSSVHSLYTKKKQMSVLRDEAKIELQKIDDKTVSLTTDVETLDSPHGKERLIRENYNVKKPGEGVIVVTDPLPKKEGVKATKTDFWYSVTHFFNG